MERTRTATIKPTTWWVRYSYDGGRGEQILEAPSAEEATAAAMAAARPRYAARADAECVHAGTSLLVPADRATGQEIREVVDLSWDARDRGGLFLVVERGGLWRDGLRWYTTAARLVGSATTSRGARWLLGRSRRRLHGTDGRVDVVLRADVALRRSGEPYGCMSGEVAS